MEFTCQIGLEASDFPTSLRFLFCVNSLPHSFFFLSHMPLPPLSFISKPSHRKKIYFRFLGVSRRRRRKKKKKESERQRRKDREKKWRPTKRAVKIKCSLTLMKHITELSSTRVKIYKNVVVTHNSSSENKKNLFSVFTTQTQFFEY